MKVNTLIISLLLYPLTTLVSFVIKNSDDPNKKDSNAPYEISTTDSKKMDGNNISTWYRNNGSFNRDPSTGNSGFEWPKGSGKYARYASGLWMGAVVGDDTLIAVAEYDYEYLPGYIDNAGNPQGKDDPLYRVYKINKGDSVSSDYQNWPANQGAYTDARGKPLLIGNETMFYSYTDGYPEAHGNNAGNTDPLNAVILHTNWSFKQSYGLLDDVIFTEYKIINKGSLAWTKCYLGIWTDDDIGSSSDDAVGCDTNLNLGYTYNFGPIDGSYGSSPPAAGFLLLKGPDIQSAGDTVKYFNPPGSSNLIIKPNYKNQNISSISVYTNGLAGGSDPSNYVESYLVLQGIRSNGAYWINPVSGLPSIFPFSGDPETNTGWLMADGFNRRFLLNTGPITQNPGDTQTILIAQIISKGSSNKNSVTKLKQAARSVKIFFDNNFDVDVNPPLPKVSSYAPGNGKVYLSWNDSCERVSYKNILSGGTYKFQGYNIYQVRPNPVYPNATDTILIKTFDIIDGVKEIRDSVYVNSYEGVVYGIVQRGSDNGVSRYIIFDKDSLANREFVNGSEYKFSVTAYYFDPAGGLLTLPKVNKTKISSNIIRVTPQSLTPGTQLSYNYGDIIKTDQIDLAVMPIVFEPFNLKSASYRSTFGTTDSSLSYTLTKTINGVTTTLVQNSKDFSGVPDTANVIDGFLMVNQMIRDSGIVRDPVPSSDTSFKYIPDYQFRSKNLNHAWTYEPAQNLWFEGPDTIAVMTAKVITARQFQSRSIGMSAPSVGNFRNARSRIFATGKYFTPVTGQAPILTGGPLRKIKIVFGQSSVAYRFIPTDTNILNTPYVNMVSVPFSAFAIDELDSSEGNPRQLNTGFLDKDSNGVWDPDTSVLGNYHFTYIFASDYNSSPQPNYTSKNPGINSNLTGFPAMDVMYAWLPRAKKSPAGAPMNFSNGDVLTVSPYRISRAEFVPGYPVSYSWKVEGTTVNSSAINSSDINNIKVFPNPYFGTSELEYDSGGEKFIYFSNLPLKCNIYIYSLNGGLVNSIARNVNDPGDSLEKWDLKNSSGSNVASGMYIVYVDCNELGSKTLKMAVFTTK